MAKKKIEKEKIKGKDNKESKRKEYLDIFAYGNVGHVGRATDGSVRTSDTSIESVGISKNADPDRWYESLNPALNTDGISLAVDFIPTLRRMIDKDRKRSGWDEATEFEEKMWKAYTHGDISGLPKSKYRFDNDDDSAQYVGLPKEQAVIIQSLLDKEYIDKVTEEAYEKADDVNKSRIERYRKAFNKFNKNLFDNPGKWVLVSEELSPFHENIYDENFQKVYDTSGLGALKNFSVRWNPEEKMLDVKDNYDFHGKKLAEKLIPERDIPLRIRERIKYDPKRGSLIKRDSSVLGQRFERRFREGGKTENSDLIASKQKQIYTYLTSERGFKPVQALAVIGNVMAESGLKEDVYGDNNTSYGIQQWHNERKDKLFKEAKKKGHDVPTFEDQIEFLADEYEGKTGYTNFLYKTRGKKKSGYYNYSQKEFEEAGSLRDAVVAWNQGAGRPHKSVIRNDDRYKAALEAAQNIGVEIEDGPSYYTEDGFNPDAIPETDTEIIEPKDEVLVEGQDTNEDLKDWIRSYGEEMLYKMMSMSNNAVRTDPDEERVEANEISERDKQDKIQDQKRQALISAFLPNLQLKIKGVTEVRD